MQLYLGGSSQSGDHAGLAGEPHLDDVYGYYDYRPTTRPGTAVSNAGDPPNSLNPRTYTGRWLNDFGDTSNGPCVANIWEENGNNTIINTLQHIGPQDTVVWKYITHLIHWAYTEMGTVYNTLRGPGSVSVLRDGFSLGRHIQPPAESKNFDPKSFKIAQ